MHPSAHPHNVVCTYINTFLSTRRHRPQRSASVSWRLSWPATETSTGDSWTAKSAKWPRWGSACSNSWTSTKSFWTSNWPWTWRSMPTGSSWRARRTGKHVPEDTPDISVCRTFLGNASFEFCFTQGLELCKNDKNAKPRNARFSRFKVVDERANKGGSGRPCLWCLHAYFKCCLCW